MNAKSSVSRASSPSRNSLIAWQRRAALLRFAAGPLALAGFFLPWASGPGPYTATEFTGFTLVGFAGRLQGLDLSIAAGATLWPSAWLSSASPSRGHGNAGWRRHTAGTSSTPLAAGTSSPAHLCCWQLGSHAAASSFHRWASRSLLRGRSASSSPALSRRIAKPRPRMRLSRENPPLRHQR